MGNRTARLLALALLAAASSLHAAEDAARCPALAHSSGQGITITASTWVQPDGSWSPPAQLGAPAPVSVAFCRVEGRLEGRIGFELWLPPAAGWNGRLLGAGVGGDAGVYNFRDLARGVTAGYAAVTNDSGHKVSEPLWMMRADAVADYTHRSQHVMNQAARRLIAAYYGSAPHHAYFLGCSGGGRQALKEMQRFPQDYDGLIAGAGAPTMPVMSARHLWHALYQQQHPAGALGNDDWKVVTDAVVQACDAKDGVDDGVVEDPASCHFDPQSVQCAAGQAGACLAPAQVETVRQFYAPLRDENGQQRDSGLVPGVTARPGPPSPLLLPLFAQGAHHDPDWRAGQFNMVRDLAWVDREMPEMRADDADLRAFIRRGGRALLYQGWLDPSVVAGQSLDYYQKVRQTLGAGPTDEAVQLYMVPGMLHCRGGEGVDQFGGATDPLPVGDADHDLLTALTGWVERGTRPRQVVASRLESGHVVRQRPLCPYPQVATFQGGDPAQASSFRCAAASPQHIDGRHAAGARWAIDMPGDWNGSLLLYGRGYGAGPDNTAPETAPRDMRAWLLSQGYALAASAYTGAGWALEEAPRDQLEVLDAFVARYGKPKRTIAWGNSMGGLVSVVLAEQHAGRIDGALPLCGSVSGSLGMLNTALDGAFAFRTLLAPDSAIRVVNVDDDRANSARVQAVLDTAWQSPQGRARVMLAAALAQIPTWTSAGTPQPGSLDGAAQAEEVRKSFVMGVFLPRVDQERRAGGLYSWNVGVDYRKQLTQSGRLEMVRDLYRQAGLDLDRDLATLQAAPRSAADPRAVAYMRANYVPSGKLGVPVLTMQTIGDGLTVPATHGSLREFVQRAGRQDLLGQVYVRGAGHCTFTPAENVAALHTLEQRLDTGHWDLAPTHVAQRTSDAPGETRFIDYQPPALLRSCGATPGSCPGEPRSDTTRRAP